MLSDTFIRNNITCEQIESLITNGPGEGHDHVESNRQFIERLKAERAWREEQGLVFSEELKTQLITEQQAKASQLVAEGTLTLENTVQFYPKIESWIDRRIK